MKTALRLLFALYVLTFTSYALAAEWATGAFIGFALCGAYLFVAHNPKYPNHSLRFHRGEYITLVVILAVGASVYYDVPEIFRRALAWIDGVGPLGPLVFIGLYIAATVAFLPGSVLTLGAGLVFGVVWGSIYVSIASTLGAAAAFLVGRYLARDWVSAKIQGNKKFKAIDEAVAGEGWKIVGLTRLSPVFPFNLLNYAYGLTSVSLRDFFFASWIGMMPGTVMYVYIGSLAGDLATLGSGGAAQSPAKTALTVIGFIATVAVTVYITKIARGALDARIKS